MGKKWESLSMEALLKAFAKDKICPICKAEVKTKIEEKKTLFKVVRTHFCSGMNGHCKVILSYGKNKK